LSSPIRKRTKDNYLFKLKLDIWKNLKTMKFLLIE
jgi:hypothetical protein